MTAPKSSDDPQWGAAVQFIGETVVVAMDGLANTVGASNELVAHGAMWAALLLAQRDIGGPGVVDWLRNQADTLEAGIMARNPCQLFN